VMNIFKGAMEGVAYLHGRGIIHNDLKPDNMLVMDEFRVGVVPRICIADFGCARTDRDRRPIWGDPRYMGPEAMQAMIDFVDRNRPSWRIPRSGPACDIWSMGATLFELLSGGILPFLDEQCPPLDLGDATFSKLRDACLGTQKIEVRKYCGEASPNAQALLFSMLNRCPISRISAKKALESAWFKVDPLKRRPGRLGFRATEH